MWERWEKRDTQGLSVDQLSLNKCQLMDNGLGLDFQILPETLWNFPCPFISPLFHLVWRRLVQMPEYNVD